MTRTTPVFLSFISAFTIASSGTAAGGAAPTTGATTATVSATIEPVSGLVWMVGKVGGDYMGAADIEKVLDANPLIAGLFLHRRWNEVEPERGVLKWESLDAAIAAAHRKGRFYKLLFIPGTGTPDWVYKAGAQVFETKGTNPYRKDTYNKPVRAPIPWDPVYVREFEAFIKAAGQRYSADPQCRAIGITGANFQSAESHLPKTPADIEKWEALGYRDKLPKAYAAFTDLFANAFPRQQIVLHLSTAVRNNDGVMEKVAADGAKRYPARFTLQNCQLSGKNDNAGLFSYALIQPYAGKVHVGYQSLAALEGGDRMGDSQVAVYNFVRGHGEYWELWHGNGQDAKLCQWLAGEIARAKKLGPDAYRAELEKSGKRLEPPRAEK